MQAGRQPVSPVVSQSARLLLYSHGITECMHLRQEGIQEICFDWPQHETIIET